MNPIATCSKCVHVGPKIPTEKVTKDGIIYVDEKGLQWKYNQCPACACKKSRESRLRADERKRDAEYWDGLIKKSRALKSKNEFTNNAR